MLEHNISCTGLEEAANSYTSYLCYVTYSFKSGAEMPLHASTPPSLVVESDEFAGGRIPPRLVPKRGTTESEIIPSRGVGLVRLCRLFIVESLFLLGFRTFKIKKKEPLYEDSLACPSVHLLRLTCYESTGPIWFTCQ
ncbi:hypothetical protein EVAR_40543_1 [Eumeta japonica]|uniref:Uncharacterized protein n=1 Tax=Eumeta variegata TaxID=151549 RepID=A0A4C1XSS9_EUMVA|nr:hypothetical protein EVAR_40543_1 [Eumeta japonica]